MEKRVHVCDKKLWKFAFSLSIEKELRKGYDDMIKNVGDVCFGKFELLRVHAEIVNRR